MTTDEVGTSLESTDGWSVDGAFLYKRFEFKNFAESLEFVNRVGALAEKADHHPDISFGWGYAELRTMTHDRKGITDVDFALVASIDALDKK